MSLDCADDLLRAYLAAIMRWGSAPSPSYTVHSGSLAELFCATKGCGGFPRLEHEEQGRIPVWKCSSCRKPWRFEQVELSRGEIGGRVGGSLRNPNPKGRSLAPSARLRAGPRSSSAGRGLASTRAAEVLGDIAQVLDQVATDQPHGFTAWRIFLFDDTEVRSGISKSIGIPMDDDRPGRCSVRQRMIELLDGGFLPPTEHAVTLYRVRKWISGARRQSWDLYDGRRMGVRCRRRSY